MLKIVEINDSRICHETPSVWTSEYHNYCVRLLTQALERVQSPVNVIFGPVDPIFARSIFKNDNRIIRGDIQSEHTLVKMGGRSVDEVVWGDTDLLFEEGKYLIRVPDYDYYAGLDFTIEYSMPNIVNMGTNSRFDDYLKKATYIAPVIYDAPDFSPYSMTPKVATVTMGNTSERRSEFQTLASEGGLDIKNITGLIDQEQLRRIYGSIRTMVNVHQTDHHHTLEELRILPALVNGVIIVSEYVPLRHTVPYADSILWSTYGGLADTVKSVQEHYDEYYEKIFTGKLKDTIRQLHEDNLMNMTKVISVELYK